METKPKLFLSHSSRDCEIADKLEREILHITNKEIEISRYTKDVTYKGSFKEFMNSIQEHDYVLCIVSDDYLKSTACMYEVGEVIKDHNYIRKLLFVVLSDIDNKHISDSSHKISVPEIYDPIKRAGYIKYWQDKCSNLKKSIDNICDMASRKLLDELYVMEKICFNDIGVFLEFLSDSKGKNFDDLFNTHFIDIIKCILPQWDKKMFMDIVCFPELLKNAIQEICKITDTDYNQIALKAKTSSHQHGLVVSADNITNGKQRYRLVAVDGLMSKVVSTGQLCNVKNVKNDKNYFDAVAETMSELVVPIKIDGNTIGVINSEAEKIDYYSNSMIEAIMKISQDFALALIRLGYHSNVPEYDIPHIHI